MSGFEKFINLAKTHYLFIKQHFSRLVQMDLAYADKLNIAEKIETVSKTLENIVGKKEKILLTRIFSCSHNLRKPSTSGSFKIGIDG